MTTRDSRKPATLTRVHPAAVVFFCGLVLLGTMACSLSSVIRLFPPATPLPTSLAFLTRPVFPTFTPTVLPVTDTPFPPTPTITPTPTDTPTPGPSPTPTATEPPTVTPTPGPAIIVPVAELNVRSGPGIDYPLAGTLRQGDTYNIVGRNADYTWWLVCCVDGDQRVWVTASLVRVDGDATDVEVVQVEPAPPPTFTPGPPTETPTITPTPTENVNFDVDNIEEFPVGAGNDYLRVGAEIRASNGAPLWGYRLQFVKEGTGEVFTSRAVSDSSWHYSNVDYRIFQWTPAPDYRRVNLQFDTNGLSDLGNNTWQVYVVDGGGRIRESVVVRLYTSAVQTKWYYIQFKRRF